MKGMEGRPQVALCPPHPEEHGGSPGGMEEEEEEHKIVR